MRVKILEKQCICLLLNSIAGLVLAVSDKKAFDKDAVNLLSPTNVTVSVISPNSIMVRWTMSKSSRPSSEAVLRFDVTLKPVDESYKIVIPVVSSQLSARIEHLSPAIVYRLSVTSIGNKGRRGKSDLVTFQMPAFKARTVYQRQWQGLGPPLPPPLPVRPDLLNTTSEFHLTIRAEEVGIVVLVLVAWAGSILLFFNRWGKIRMLLPYQPVFKEQTSSVGSPVHNLGNQPITKQQQSFQETSISYSIPRCNHYGLFRSDTTAYDPDQSQLPSTSAGPSFIRETVNETASPRSKTHRTSYEIPQIRLLDASRRSKSAEAIPALLNQDQEKPHFHHFISPANHKRQRKQKSWAAYRRHTDPWLSVLVELAQSRINLAKQKTSSTTNLDGDEKSKKSLKPLLGRLQAPSLLCSQSSVSSNSSISTVINVPLRDDVQGRPPRLGNVSTSLPLPRLRYNSLATLGRPEKPRSVNLESMKREDSDQRCVPYRPLLEKHKSKLSQSSHESSIASSSTNEDEYCRTLFSSELADVFKEMPMVEDQDQMKTFNCDSLPKITKQGERRKSLLQLRRAFLTCEPIASDKEEEVESDVLVTERTELSVDI